MKRLILLIVFVFLLIGCRGTKPTVTKEKTVKDSISTTVQIVPRDTIVSIPADSLKVKVKLNDLSPIPIQWKSESKKVTAKISRPDKDNIVVECDTDLLELELELKDVIINTLKQREVSETETIRVPVKFTPWYKNLLAAIGGLALALIIALIGIKLLKP